MTVWHTYVRRGELSGLEESEGLDPAVCCPHGYALISVEMRGSGTGDGPVITGTQEEENGFDVTEAVAKMTWCNGNFGMAGNSYLAISPWFIASTRPPSLKAITPWEGASDLYREQFCRGGWFSMSNFDLISKETLRGPPNSRVEDFAEMCPRSPIINAFRNDKRVDLSKIESPAYIWGRDVSNLHNLGGIRAWMRSFIPRSGFGGALAKSASKLYSYLEAH